MNLTWVSTTNCTKLFKAIQHTNPMINLSFDQNGLHIQSMDASKSSLVKLELHPSHFAAFTCTAPFHFGVYTETLCTILQRSKNSTLMWRSNGDTLDMILTKDDQKTSFQLRSIEIEEDQLSIPELEDDVAVVVASEVMRDWMSKVHMAKSDVSFNITDTVISCSSESTEMGHIKHTEPLDGERVRLVCHRANVQISLSYHSTQSMAVFSGCGGEKSLVGFSNEQPTRLRVNMSDGHSYLCLYVAPKIEE